MKYKEIKLEDNKSVLVDDSADIEIRDYFLVADNIEQCLSSSEADDLSIGKSYPKIIATINHSISLDVPMIIMEDEVEKIALNMIIDISKKQFLSLGTLANIGEGIILGYKAAQQKSYSEEDIISNFQEKYYEFINSGGLNGSSSEWIDHSKLVPWFKNYIQSLKQEYIELEMESGYVDGSVGNDRIKTNRVNGQLIAYVKK